MKAILLVPADDDPHGLLAPSFPFARVPTVHRGRDWVPIDGWREGGKPDHYVGAQAPPAGYWTAALVLAWAGDSVAEGCERAARVLAQREGMLVGLTAPTWWRFTPAGGGWCLGETGPTPTDGAVVYVSEGLCAIVDIGRQTWHTILGVSEILNPVVALATVCAARLGCTVVTIDGEEAR